MCALASKSHQTTEARGPILDGFVKGYANEVIARTCEITEFKSTRDSARAKTMTSATQIAGEGLQSKRARGPAIRTNRGVDAATGGGKTEAKPIDGKAFAASLRQRSRANRQGPRQIVRGYSSGLRRPGQPGLCAQQGQAGGRARRGELRSSPVHFAPSRYLRGVEAGQTFAQRSTPKGYLRIHLITPMRTMDAISVGRDWLWHMV